MYDLHHYLADNTDDLSADFPSQIAAAELVLDIIRQPPWTPEEKDRRREQLRTEFQNWYDSGPFSSQKWSTVTTVVAWQPLAERARIFYEDMEVYITHCISILNDPGTVVPNTPNDPENPVGHVLIFYDLVRLIMGTVNYTPLPREYRALISAHFCVLSDPNPVKEALQRDEVWMNLLKGMVAYVRCVEEDTQNFHGDFNPTTAACNLTKMRASVVQSIPELDAEYKRLLAVRTELQVHAGLTIAQHRHSEVGPRTDVLMHQLLRLTHG